MQELVLARRLARQAMMLYISRRFCTAFSGYPTRLQLTQFLFWISAYTPSATYVSPFLQVLGGSLSDEQLSQPKPTETSWVSHEQTTALIQRDALTE